MLKQVGASGQISLGKRFAGQLFEVQFLDSGEIRLKPVQVVPVTKTADVAQVPGAVSQDKHKPAAQ